MADTDPGSLDRLHDIVVPAPVPWWPPAPGWYVVGALALVLLGLGAWSTLARRMRARYRRVGQSELDRLPCEAANLPAVAELLKRVALAAYPRDRVASLTGPDWLAFLDETGGTTQFSAGSGRPIGDAAYSRPPLPWTDSQLADVWTAARHWIAHHRC